MTQAVDRIATHWEEEHFGWCWRCCLACKQVAERLLLPAHNEKPRLKNSALPESPGGPESPKAQKPEPDAAEVYTSELKRLQARLKRYHTYTLTPYPDPIHRPLTPTLTAAGAAQGVPQRERRPAQGATRLRGQARRGRHALPRAGASAQQQVPGHVGCRRAQLRHCAGAQGGASQAREAVQRDADLAAGVPRASGASA